MTCKRPYDHFTQVKKCEICDKEYCTACEAREHGRGVCG